MKIVFYTAVWGRPKVTELCYIGLTRLISHIPYECEVVVVGSEATSEIVANEYGFDYVHAANEPLGAKWNAGLKHVMTKDFDYMIQLGSDDLIANELFDLYKPLFGVNDFFGLSNLVFLDPLNKKAKSFIYEVEVMGAARCFSKSMLSKTVYNVEVEFLQGIGTQLGTYNEGDKAIIPVKYAESWSSFDYLQVINEDIQVVKLWNNDRVNSLDWNSEFNLNILGYNVHKVKTDRLYVADIKTKDNIWGYDALDGGKEVDFIETIAMFSKQEQDILLDGCWR